MQPEMPVIPAKAGIQPREVVRVGLALPPSTDSAANRGRQAVPLRIVGVGLALPKALPKACAKYSRFRGNDLGFERDLIPNGPNTGCRHPAARIQEPAKKRGYQQSACSGGSQIPASHLCARSQHPVVECPEAAALIPAFGRCG